MQNTVTLLMELKIITFLTYKLKCSWNSCNSLIVASSILLVFLFGWFDLMALAYKWRKGYMAEDIDYTDDQLVGNRGWRSSGRNSFWRTIINFFPGLSTSRTNMKQRRNCGLLMSIGDKYRSHSLEDISQKTSAMKNEKHPTWLIEHLDCIKKALEKELIDVKKEF